MGRIQIIEDLKSKAPTLLQLVTSVVSVNDHRNTSKVGNSHHPGICAAFAVLLKERNREMCGLQSIVSVLMYVNATYSSSVSIDIYLTGIPIQLLESPQSLWQLQWLMDDLSPTHSVPLQKWIVQGVVFKF